MKKFNEWYQSINEELGEPTASAEPTVADVKLDTTSTSSGRDEIIHDIDAIMTSLEALSGELTESLNEDGLATVAGAAAAGAALVGVGMGVKKLYDATVTAPKARKAQAKVNAMSLKIAGVENTLASADKNQKEKIKAKIDAAKAQRDELQSALDDRYESSSNLVKKAISAEKRKGRMEVLKATLGEASPEQQKQIKDQLGKLKSQVAKDEAEFAQDAKEAKEGASEEDKNKFKELTDKNKEASKQDDGANQETKKDREEKNSKEGKLKRLEDLLKKAEESGDEEKIKKVKELIDRVSTKESWQLHDTPLGMLIESEITKLENSFKLNESRHVANSIKDRFNQLL